MAILTALDRDAIGDTLKLSQFSLDDFVLTETAAPPALALAGDPVAGWVTVRSLSTGKARTYSEGPSHDWLSRFRRDLDSRVFGDR